MLGQGNQMQLNDVVSDNAPLEVRQAAAVELFAEPGILAMNTCEEAQIRGESHRSCAACSLHYVRQIRLGLSVYL